MRSDSRGSRIRGGLAIVLTLFAGSVAAAELRVNVQNDEGQGLTNVAVIVEPQGFSLQPSGDLRAQIDQIDRQFVPHVQLVQTNTSISFPNFDDIRHHVFSFSEAKRFELPLYKGTPADPVVFDQAGIVVLGCNIHDTMLGYVYVTDSPWASLTDGQGLAAIPVPEAASYLVRIWHPSLGSETSGIEQRVKPEHLGDLTVVLQAEEMTTGRRQLRRTTRYP